MEQITHYQVQELVMQLPVAKLLLAYNLLLELVDDQKSDTPSSVQVDFMRLSLDDRKRILAQQAEQMVAHYGQTATERQEWQAGDFTNESESR
ncbi:MAG: hypothetical protein DRR08_32810 [Candidatus Parabeggiatoa sp. nov. 2]|nr:MAG: hypothetical protein B6247_30420 [Beggiatoa sp. 4572_84]RKZ46980.1 MAG: hypothetical protein DRR08_32810 [Gammaproteobacteria bacterium]